MHAARFRQRTRDRPVAEFSSSFALDRKLKEACKGLLASPQWLIMELPRDEDKELIADFIIGWSNSGGDGVMMAPNTKRGYISALVYLSRYLGHKKSFREMTRQDIIDGYLNSLKKDFDSDKDQKWINTYNSRAAKYLAFWKWLTQPDLQREERQVPPQVKGLRFPKRKNKTTVKREQMWTAEEHKAFLDYCEDLRLACYHAVAKDTGGRPGELLQLKISDVEIKVSPSTAKKYAEFWIGREGKMKRGRPVSISDAIPYFNVWTAVHPLRDRPQGAYLFPSRDNRAKYRNVPLKPDSLRLAYVRTIEEFFPKLLNRPDVPLEDKAVLRRLIHDKPHYPYLRRHEFSTEIAPRVSQQSFNQLLGHSKTSRMYEVYVHDLGVEGNRELLISKGILSREETLSSAQVELQAKYCPICQEANKHQADFCFKCNWVLSVKGMQEVMAADAQAAKEAAEQKKRMDEMQKEIDRIRDMWAPSEGLDRLFDEDREREQRRHTPANNKPLPNE
jgi:integrase